MQTIETSEYLKSGEGVMLVKDGEDFGGENNTLHHYMLPSQTLMSVTNEESELALIKGLRSGKVTLQTDDSLGGNITDFAGNYECATAVETTL